MRTLPRWAAAILGCAIAATAQTPPDEDTPVLGAPSAFDLSEEREETLFLPPGTRLYKGPAFRASVINHFTQETPVLLREERPSGWSEVRYAGQIGWIPRAGAGAATADPLFETPPANPERLARARSLLASNHRELRLGPYRLFTDVEDDALLAKLDRVAAQIPALLEQSLGLVPQPGPDEAVVLFRDEGVYSDYLRATGDMELGTTEGHAGGGLALSYVTENKETLRRVMVHELTHLLVQSSLPSHQPPWLAEGLAETAAFNQLDDNDQFIPGTLDGGIERTMTAETVGFGGGYTVERRQYTEFIGPYAGLSHLLRQARAGELGSLSEMTAVASDDLARATDPHHFYAFSGFAVRYFLEGQDGALAPGFRTFLNGVARGRPAWGNELQKQLGLSWEELQTGYEAWLLETGCALRLAEAKRCRKLRARD